MTGVLAARQVVGCRGKQAAAAAGRQAAGTWAAGTRPLTAAVRQGVI